MKKFIACFAAITGCCFAASPTVHPNLLFILHEYQNGSVLKATQFATNFINDPVVSNVDKVHYLVLRIRFWLDAGQPDLHQMDMNMLKVLIEQFPECKEEFYLNYDCSIFNTENYDNK